MRYSEKTGTPGRRQFEIYKNELKHRLREEFEEEYRKRFEKEIDMFKTKSEKMEQIVAETKTDCDRKIWEIENFYLTKITTLFGEKTANEVEQEAEEIKQKIKTHSLVIEKEKDDGKMRKIDSDKELSKLFTKIEDEMETIKEYTESLEKRIIELHFEEKWNLARILRPENGVILAEITKNLDTQSFSSLIQTSQRLYNWAERGVLRKDVHLEMEMGSSEIPTFIYNNRRLDLSDVIYLTSAPWVKLTMDRLDIRENNIRLRIRNRTEVDDMDHRLEKVLKHMNIKYIDAVQVESRTNFQFLETCKVGTLEAKEITNTDFLDFPNSLQINNLLVEFHRSFGSFRYGEYLMNTRFEEFDDFVVYSLAQNIEIKKFHFSRTVVSRIVQAWQEGRKKFNEIKLDLKPEDKDRILGDLLDSNKILHVGRRLNQLPYKEIMKMIYKPGSMILCGEEDTFVVIRNGEQMLLVDFTLSALPKVNLKLIVNDEEDGHDEN